jgi:hypothetical protein
MMSLGPAAGARAAARAASICDRSWPSTRWTDQPQAWNLAAVSSENARSVLPSMVIRLSS